MPIFCYSHYIEVKSVKMAMAIFLLLKKLNRNDHWNFFLLSYNQMYWVNPILWEVEEKTNYWDDQNLWEEGEKRSRLQGKVSDTVRRKT